MHRILRATADVVALLVIMAALGVGVLRWSGMRTGTVSAPRELIEDNWKLSSDEFLSIANHGQWSGPRTAPVTMVVYSNYSCGYCQRLFNSLQQLRYRYPDHLAISWKHFVDPARSTPAVAMAKGAECAAELGLFLEYHSEVFRSPTAVRFPDGYLAVARRVGIPDLESFQQCVDSGRYTAKLERHFSEASRLGIDATPTSLINGVRLVGALPTEALDTVIALQFRQ